MTPWPFTDPERRAVRDAYEALSRVGNVTRDARVFGPDSDHRDPILDRAHHDLGLVVMKLERLENLDRLDRHPPPAT